MNSSDAFRIPCRSKPVKSITVEHYDKKKNDVNFFWLSAKLFMFMPVSLNER